MRELACTLERFQKDAADHVMEVVKDDGVHRHLKFRRPGTFAYGFDIVTWPGYLAMSGDMGCSVFTRLPDMFEFFRPDARWERENAGKLCINPGYWAEKCVANDGPKQTYNEQLLVELVRRLHDEHVAERLERGDKGKPLYECDMKLMEALELNVLNADDAHDAVSRMDEFDSDGTAADTNFPTFRFGEPWEYGSQLEEYTFHFIWRLYAIAHAIKAYDEAKAAAAAPTHVQV